jgi:hypothetical protein
MTKLDENSLVSNLRNRFKELSQSIPDLLGKVDASGHLKVNGLKKNLLKRLDSKRKKFRLALESLGWGTLADLLDAAFCGEKLNIWV